MIFELEMYLPARLFPIISRKNWSKPHTLVGDFCQVASYSQSMWVYQMVEFLVNQPSQVLFAQKPSESFLQASF